MMNDTILRYSAFGCRYRVKILPVLFLPDYDFFRFMETVCNQETGSKSAGTLEQIVDVADESYKDQITTFSKSMQFPAEFTRFEKHLYQINYMIRFLTSDEYSGVPLSRAEIRGRCKRYYADRFKQAQYALLNYEGINFDGFSKLYMSGGTPLTLLYLVDNKMLPEGYIEEKRRLDVKRSQN